MLVDIIDVKVKNGYVLWLKFEDGTEGDVDIKNLLGDFSGVFTRFCDKKYFQSVKVNAEIGTISWPENVDLCPDVLYAAVKGITQAGFNKDFFRIKFHQGLNSVAYLFPIHL